MNLINGKTYPYIIIFFIRNYNCSLDPKLGKVVVAVIRITCSFHDCTKQFSLSWYYKIKDACNQSRYGKVYDFKYSLINL